MIHATWYIRGFVVLAFSLSLWAAVILPLYASSVDYIPLAPIDAPGSEFTGEACPPPTCFPRYLRTLYNVGIAIAGLFAVLSIVRGGFEFMWTDSYLNKSEGKAIILRAIGGVIIVYSSYILMNQISPSLGRDLDLSLQFKEIDIQEDTSTLELVDLRTAMFKSVVQGVINNSKTARERAENEEQLARDILNNPDIKALQSRKDKAGQLLYEDGNVAEAAKIALSPEENTRLDAAVAESAKHYGIADNTRVFSSALHTVNQQEANAAILKPNVGTGWFGVPLYVSSAANTGDFEGSAQFMSNDIKQKIAALRAAGGDVAAPSQAGEGLVAKDPKIGTVSSQDAVNYLVARTNEAVAELCSKQYKLKVTDDRTVANVGSRTNSAILKNVNDRDTCIANNSVR